MKYEGEILDLSLRIPTQSHVISIRIKWAAYSCDYRLWLRCRTLLHLGCKVRSEVKCKSRTFFFAKTFNLNLENDIRSPL